MKKKIVFSNVNELISYLQEGLKKSKEIESFIENNEMLNQIWNHGSFITDNPELSDDLLKVLIPNNYDHFYIKPLPDGIFEVQDIYAKDDLLHYFFTKEQSEKFEKYEEDFTDLDLEIGNFRFRVDFPLMDKRFNFYYLKILKRDEDFNLVREYYNLFRDIIDSFSGEYKFIIPFFGLKGKGKKSFWGTIKERVNDEIYDIQFRLSRMFPDTIMEFNIGLDENNIKVSKLTKKLYNHISNFFKIDYILVQRNHQGYVYYTLELNHNKIVEQFFHNRSVNGINFVDGHRIPLPNKPDKDLEILKKLYNDFSDEFLLVITEDGKFDIEVMVD